MLLLLLRHFSVDNKNNPNEISTLLGFIGCAEEVF